MKKSFALFGQNIGYSLSPKIHQMIYAHMGIEADYRLISADSGQFPGALRELFELDGFNVTKPYKKRILDFIHSVDGDWAAVNLVVNRGGKRIGYNTDYYGFKKHFSGIIDPKDHRALILGAGGVAEAAVPFLLSAGADVYVYNRTKEKADELCQRYGAVSVPDKTGRYEIVVNCTSYGLNAGENAGEGIDFSETFAAYDMLYFETEFLKTAAAAGVPFVADGLAMLVHQAIRADELLLDTAIHDKDGLFQKIMNEIKEQKK